jgi:hypothetical protein
MKLRRSPQRRGGLGAEGSAVCAEPVRQSRMAARGRRRLVRQRGNPARSRPSAKHRCRVRAPEGCDNVSIVAALFPPRACLRVQRRGHRQVEVSGTPPFESPNREWSRAGRIPRQAHCSQGATLAYGEAYSAHQNAVRSFDWKAVAELVHGARPPVQDLRRARPETMQFWLRRPGTPAATGSLTT